MKVLVFDIPAESGGALSILNDFYNQVRRSNITGVQWTFILSKPTFKNTGLIKIKNFKWIKKSWFHRLFFDYFIAPRLVKKYNPDLVFSLQNTMIPNSKYNQILYIHQSLPFISYRFKMTESPKYWVYQRMIGKLILKSIRKVDYVIVQTHWLKKSIQDLSKINASKILVVPPTIPNNNLINKSIIKGINLKDNKIKRFIYPASGDLYKNHKVIIDAVSIIKKQKKYEDFEVIFTLDGTENKHIKKLYEIVEKENLPIKFKGIIEREDLMVLYTKTILLFPSYVETFGLPLLEAKLKNSIIISAKEPFALEVLGDYNNAYFFNKFDASKLAEIMVEVLLNKIDVNDNENQSTESDLKLEQIVLDLYSQLKH